MKKYDANNFDCQKREFYTGNGWIGSRCPDRYLPVKEIAGYVREFIKKNPDLSACKWSVKSKSYSGGQSLTVCLMAAPFEVFSDYWKEKNPYDVEHGYSQHADYEKSVTPETFEIIDKIKSFVLSFNYDDSNGMIDYFDRGFYDSYYIGTWEKPFQRIEKKVNAAKKEEKQAVSGNYKVIDYSEKAIALTGDTAKIKEQLKALGGKFNARLSCGAGWIFSKKRAAEVYALVGM